jgi:hypothetical protein
VAEQDAFELRWKNFRRKFRARFRELCIEGHVMQAAYIFPECRVGRCVMRRVHVVLEGEEPVEFYLNVRARRKMNACRTMQ